MINIPFTIFATDSCQKADFFGLVPWYHYLKLSTTCEISHFKLLPGGGQQSDIPLVLLAIVDDLLRIAGIVAVAFVLIGAAKYVSSEGNPEKTASAQSTIINALIGAAVSIVAVGIVSFLGSQLGG
ncbi:MAG: hypothetical protein NVS1B10_04460 [Candidatus Saccharimonadales bacterium]